MNISFIAGSSWAFKLISQKNLKKGIEINVLTRKLVVEELDTGLHIENADEGCQLSF